jgi:hypothetical protein
MTIRGVLQFSGWLRRTSFPRQIAVGLIFSSLCVCVIVGECHAGRFINDLIVKILPDGENMELVQSYAFEDDEKRIWEVPPGTKVDGASIPRPLWSLVGSPLKGKYREASVIHDFFCENRRRPWDQTHKVFYDAMLANGVSAVQAKTFYFAVYRFGPRWNYSVKGYCPPGTRCNLPSEAPLWEVSLNFTPKFNEKAMNEVVEAALKGDISDIALKDQIDSDVYAEAFLKAEQIALSGPTKKN